MAPGEHRQALWLSIKTAAGAVAVDAAVEGLEDGKDRVIEDWQFSLVDAACVQEASQVGERLSPI